MAATTSSGLYPFDNIIEDQQETPVRNSNRVCRCMEGTHSYTHHVGVNINEGPVLFQPATKTTGICREIGMVSADTQLLADSVMRGTSIRMDDIADGGFGRVVGRYVKSDGLTNLTSLIKTANSSIPLPKSRFPYATKIMVATQKNLLETSIISEFVLRNLNDPGVVKIGAASFQVDATTPATISTYLSMDRAEMTVHDLVEEAIAERKQIAMDDGVKVETLPLFACNEYKMLTYQLIRSLAFLHSELIIHGDIKRSNALVSAITNVPAECLDFVMVGRTRQIRTFKVIQLADFGLCLADYRQPLICPYEMMYTLDYRPPEFIFGINSSFYDSSVRVEHNQYITPKSDIWAMGCVLYAMATGHNFLLCRQTRNQAIRENAEAAVQLIQIYGKKAFSTRKSLFPCYGTTSMKTACGMISTIYANPWDDKELAKHPGLVPLLQSMLAVDPADRVDMFTLMHNTFFTQSNVGHIFNMAMHMSVDPVPKIAYCPNSMNVETNYILSHMLKTLPSERDPTRTSTFYRPNVYRCLAARLPSVLAPLFSGRLKHFVGEMCYIFESKVLALVHIWTLKNTGEVLITDADQCKTALLVFIMIVLKTMHIVEDDALRYLGYDKSEDNQAVLIKSEYTIIKELDFDVWVSAPYDYYTLFVENIKHKYPTHVKTSYMQPAFVNAKNLLRLMCFDPDIVWNVASIQIIDIVLDICVRSKVPSVHLGKYKSQDPHYSQFGSDDVMHLTRTIAISNLFIKLSTDAVDLIIDDIIAYSKSVVVYYK